MWKKLLDLAAWLHANSEGFALGLFAGVLLALLATVTGYAMMALSFGIFGIVLAQGDDDDGDDGGDGDSDDHDPWDDYPYRDRDGSNDLQAAGDDDDNDDDDSGDQDSTGITEHTWDDPINNG